MNDLVVTHSKGITKILSFWNDQLQFKKIKRKEEHESVDLIIKMIMNKSLYSTNAFVLFPKKMIPFKEEIFANGIIIVMKKLLFLLNEDKIKKEKFAKNNDIVTFFLGNKTKKIASYYLRTKKYKVDKFDSLLVQKKVNREEYQIKPKVVKTMVISEDIKKMLVMWNRRSCFKKIIIHPNNPSKTLKSVVFLLGRYLDGNLYKTNKLVTFPNGVDPFEMENCGSLKKWEMFLDRFEQALKDKTVYPRNKTIINKYANLTNFLKGSTYSKYPSPSMLLTYCLKEPVKHTEDIAHKTDIINKLIAKYEDMVPKYKFVEEDIIIFDKCLTIMEEVIKEIGTDEKIHPVMIGVDLFKSAIKSSWKKPETIERVNYIGSAYFKKLFTSFYKKNFGGRR